MYDKYLKQLEEAGEIRNLKERSITCYKNYVSYFLNFVKKEPDVLTCQDVRDFLLAKKDEGLKATTLNLYNSSIRFFYRNVLHILWDDITVPRMIIDHKLPVVLTVDEVDRLLDATDDLKYKAMFATMYSSGMRVSEVIHLHYDDISRTNMQIHIRDAKNRMNRFTILSKRNLDILTQTTHLMEAGVEQRNIQALLGHRDPKSTEVYLHVSNKTIMGIRSPFDREEGDNNV